MCYKVTLIPNISIPPKFFICLSTVNVPTVKAAEEDTSDDTLTFVEVIEEMPTQPSMSRATKTKSAVKTVLCNDSNGKTLWSLQIAATFSYTGSSSKCTSAKASVTSNSSSWKVSVSSCTRSGNKATASAVGKKYSQRAYCSKQLLNLLLYHVQLTEPFPS